MKIVLEIRECKLNLSPKCTKTFQREARRGRPPVSCPECKIVKDSTKATPRRISNAIVLEDNSRQCGCGKTFQVKAGRGRKAEKCDECREQGKTYRRNEDGILEEIRQEQLRREEDERRREAGRERAMLLVERMKPLFNKANRTVIVH